MNFRTIAVTALSCALLLGPAEARAFCGFYVSGADQSLYNGATMVVLMREGRRTVLSMQNDYQGPPEDFALVVPVPEVLEEENVQTLPREIFDRVDQLAAPRLVEYWEQDPCAVVERPLPRSPSRMSRRYQTGAGRSGADLGVTVEAEFSVAEYDIVVLSANDSSGLDTWLRQNSYNIPEGAETVLRPYVAAGTKFFVAKVAVDRVTFDGDTAILSPLRFYYDADELELPVRLGMLNSAGKQDLIVHVLARNQRYEMANYPNAFIPTNLRVDDAVRHDFGAFYDLLYRRTVAANPGAVVTEYSWNAGSCDPCPVPALSLGELATLGADVMGDGGVGIGSGRAIGMDGRSLGVRPRFGRSSSWVLTRLHHRYGSDGLSEDLVFRAAPAVVGGRGMPNHEGQLQERGATQSSVNNFQGRYAILHPFEGEITCAEPDRGRWGGPPGQPQPSVFGARNPAMNPGALERAAGAPADAPRVTALGPVVKESIASLQIEPGVVEAALAADPGPPQGVTMPTAVQREDSLGTSGTAAASTVAEIAETPAAQTGGSGGGCGSCSISPGPAARPGELMPFAAVLFACMRRRRRL